MDNNTTTAYGWITISLLVLAIILLLATPFGEMIGEGAKRNVEEIGNTAEIVLENIKQEDIFGHNRNYTYYTQSNIDALGDKAVTIGYNDPLYVVGLYSDDKSEVIISRNGEHGDGIPVAECFADNTTLTSAILREGVMSVSNGAFRGCENLSDLFLPDGLVYIGYDAFNGTAIESIVIPDTVETIGSRAFANCPNLKSIRFLGKVKPVGFYESDYPGIDISFKN